MHFQVSRNANMNRDFTICFDCQMNRQTWLNVCFSQLIGLIMFVARDLGILLFVGKQKNWNRKSSIIQNNAWSLY